jgi:hypothetical protein
MSDDLQPEPVVRVFKAELAPETRAAIERSEAMLASLPPDVRRAVEEAKEAFERRILYGEGSQAKPA